MTATVTTPFSFKRRGVRFALRLAPDEPERVIHPEIQAKHNLSAQSALTRERWEAVFRENDVKLAMDAAARLLAKRLHSRAELKRKLRQRRFSAEIIEVTLVECERLGFLDDEAFARALVSESRGKAQGSRRILANLLKKGVDAGLAERVFADLEDPEESLAIARRAFHRKLASLTRETNPKKKREKLFRHLVGKGHPSDLIFRLFDENPF